VEKHGVQTEGAKFYSHVLPSPRERTFSERNVVGKNWRSLEMRRRGSIPSRVKAFLYAIRSGELLGRSLCRRMPGEISGVGESYFLRELEFAARIVRRFIRGSFLGSAVTTRIGAVSAAHPVFRQLMGDLFSGTQDYTQLETETVGPPGNHHQRLSLQRPDLDRPARPHSLRFKLV